ncbi:DUF2155 domain-containing protein [Rhodoblastus sp. 17X3]|uniref:DUF2155 domain-containing protein n=1 Tax=Rhodoblastus sp. 17X3 TaxID=3047026 RepID=UPI00406C47DE
MRFSRSFVSRSFFCALGAALLAPAGARADQVRHPTAIFAGLDKITGRIISFDVAIDETVQFGTLQITPRVCLTRPQTEAPLTEGFVEVDEIDAARTSKRIFSGWMFAASPGLHGVEHPVYDVWLKDCKGGVDVTASPANAQPNPNAPPPANASPAKDGAAAKKPRRTIEPQEPVEPTMDSLPPTNSDAPPPADDRPTNAPANGNGSPDGLGAPIEVGPPPGAPRTRAPANDQSAPAAPDQGFGAPGDAPPPPAPKPPKPKRKPPIDPNAAPPAGGTAAPAAPSAAPAPQPPQQKPSGPQELLEKIPFFR